MNAYSHTYFLDGKLHVRGTADVHAVLYIEPDGQNQPSYITFHLNALSLDGKAEIAERFAEGVAKWAAAVRASADSECTAADELAEARAEIARLKGDEAVAK